VLLAAEKTFLHTTIPVFTSVTTITPSQLVFTTVKTVTVPPAPPTVTSTFVVTAQHSSTDRNRNVPGLTLSNTISNTTSEKEATMPSITTATQPNLPQANDLGTSIPTSNTTSTVTVTDSTPSNDFSNTTSTLSAMLATTVSTDEISLEVPNYNRSTLSRRSPFSDTTFDIDAITSSATAATQPNAYESYGLVSVSTDVPVAILTEGDPTTTGADTGSPRTTTVVRGSNTLTWSKTFSNTTSEVEAIAPHATAAMDSLSSDPVVSIQTTMPIESIQPAIGTTVSSVLSAFSTSGGIHVSYGHPPLVTSNSDQRNWNTSTSCTESSTQEVSGIVPTSSSFITATASRVFISYPPSISGYNNATSADTSVSSMDSSTQTELATTTAATLAGISPAPIASSDLCSLGMWGQLGCHWTPASLPTTTSSHHVLNSTTIAATLVEPSTQAELATTLASTLAGAPPAPTVSPEACSPGIWGRPGCLSTPASFFDTSSTLVGQPVAVQHTDAASVSPATLGQTETQILSTHNSSITQFNQTATRAFITSSNATTTHPIQAQCTTTWYSLPTNPCTHTVYAHKTTTEINCFGCMGHHAIPSAAADESGVSSICSPTLTQSDTNYDFVGLPEPCNGDGTFHNVD
jgi:hypothetical protein